MPESLSPVGQVGEGRKEGRKGIVPIGGTKRALRDRQLRATASWTISTNCYEALEGRSLAAIARRYRCA